MNTMNNAEHNVTPQNTMPPLNDAMRAVLLNEHCVYGSADELYSALCKAAFCNEEVKKELKKVHRKF